MTNTVTHFGFVAGGKTRIANCASYESGQAKETGILTGILAGICTKLLFQILVRKLGGNSGHLKSLNEY